MSIICGKDNYQKIWLSHSRCLYLNMGRLVGLREHKPLIEMPGHEPSLNDQGLLATDN